MPRTLHEHVDQLSTEVRRAVEAYYGHRLVSLVVFGSMGRGTPRPDSDLDLLIVADPLPHGRVARVEEFAAIESALAPYLETAQREGFRTQCSPVFKTPAELRAGSPLFLDFVDDAKVLFDRSGVFATTLAELRARLRALGARRVWRGNAWYWDLKPDYRPGDVFEL